MRAPTRRASRHWWPRSYEVNRSAGRLNYQLKRHEDAVRYYEKAANQAEADINSASVLMSAYTALGEGERAKARMERALLIDPKNFNMRYNFACALCVYLEDKDAAPGMVGPVFESITETFLPYVKIDPDLDLLRDDPRFQALMAETEARLAAKAGRQAIGAT